MPEITFIPADEKRNRIRRMALIGMSEQDIADQLKMSLPRLRKRYKHDLNTASAEGKNTILQKLYEAAASGENLSATTFWVKAHLGWRDTGTPTFPPAPTTRTFMFTKLCSVCEARKKRDEQKPANDLAA